MDAVVADPIAEVEATPRARRRRALSPPKEARRTKVVKNLTDPNVIPEDELTLEKQYYGVFEAFQPRNRWQEWLTARVSTLMLRISRAERVERKLRDWASYRAFDFWEDDQRLAVEVLGEKLRRDPAKVAAKLRQSPAGLDWLARRWEALAKLGPADWDDERRELAYRLLGGDERVDPASPGFVAAQLESLEADRDRVEEADAVLRGLVESDLSDANVPDLNRLRREVRAWHRQMKWLVDQFHVEHPDRWDDPMRRPASEKVTPDGFREVNYNHFEGPRPPAFASTAPAMTPAAPTQAERPVARPRPIVAARPAAAPASSVIPVSASRPVRGDDPGEQGRPHARHSGVGDRMRE